MVLLVEDDALIRMRTAEILTELGLLVIEASSAEEAMAALQTAPIELLVTEINLPGISGNDLALKARALHPNVGIVFATGDSQISGDVPAGAALLSKPYGSDSSGKSST